MRAIVKSQGYAEGKADAACFPSGRLHVGTVVGHASAVRVAEPRLESDENISSVLPHSIRVFCAPGGLALVKGRSWFPVWPRTSVASYH